MATSIRARIDAFWHEVAETGSFWSWGDDEGITPWGDRLGDEGVPLWSSEEAARAENADDPDEDGPLALTVATTVERVVGWRGRGLELMVVVQPVRGRILLTLTLEEFALEVTKRLVVVDGLSSDVVDRLEAMALDARPRLP